MPASEEAFKAGKEEDTTRLQEALQNCQIVPSAFGARVLAVSLFYRAVKLETQTCAPRDDKDDEDEGRMTSGTEIDGDGYSCLHQSIEEDMAAFLRLLPEYLRLPQGYRRQDAVFINLIIQMAILCLHKTAVKAVRGYSSPVADFVRRKSQSRAVTAATEILSILQLIENIPMALQSPIQDFAVYTAALVFLEDFASWGSISSRRSLNTLYKLLEVNTQTHQVASLLATQLREESESLNIQL